MRVNLDKLATILTDLNIGVQLGAASETLEHLNSVEYLEDKSLIDKVKKVIVTLSGEAYRTEIHKVFFEGYSYLDDKDIERYISDLEYQKRIDQESLVISAKLLDVSSRFKIV